MSLAPIALFVYNRPEHTRQTVQHLLANRQADVSRLYIFSDGPQSPESAADVEEVRRYIRGIGGFKKIEIVEHRENLGLARSIINGVTRLCAEHGSAIVLEDDLVLSTCFLDYMNAALARYRDEQRVMHVSGYMFPVLEPHVLPETFFYRATSCWGWATWDRAWRYFEDDAAKLLSRIQDRGLEYEFNILGTTDYVSMLRNQARGNIDSWAVRWYASLFLQGGMSLHPAVSLVRNIGHDGTGAHCVTTDAYDVDLARTPPAYFPDQVEECAQAVQAMASFYRSIRSPLHKRILRRLLSFRRGLRIPA